MNIEKIFTYNPDEFLRMRKGKFFVFEGFIVFRHSDGIYACPHFRKGNLSVVDSFEQEYSHLDLKYEFVAELGGVDIKKIDNKLDSLKEIIKIRDFPSPF